jgi:pyruvate formate lyase activating enzyme
MRDCFVGAATWKRSTFNDYPGKPSVIVFFGGCNLRCPYCHNPHIVVPDYQKIEPFDPVEFMAHLRKRQGKLSGVVLSGGEPTLYPHVAEDLPAVRSLGYAVKLDTNGMLPGVIESFAPDYLALDVKTSPERYREHLGSPFPDTAQRLERSIDMVRRMGERAEVRITAAPGIIDEAAIRTIASMIAGVKKAFLQRMQNDVPLLDPSFAARPLPSMQQVRAYRDILAGFVERCGIRGEDDAAAVSSARNQRVNNSGRS